MFNQTNEGTYFGGVSTDIQLGDSNTEYVRKTPTPTAVGGCPAGTTFSGTIQDALDKILYPYQNPIVSLGTSVATTVRQLGVDVIDTLTLTATCTKKTGVLQKVEFYQGSTLLASIPCVDGTLKYTYTVTTPIKATTNFTAKVYDASAKMGTSATITYNFYYPNFSLVTTKEILDLEITDVELGNMRLEAKSTNKALTYTGTMSRYVYAYPASWGNLKSITDKSGFEFITAFEKLTMNYQSGTDVVEYNVYISREAATLNSYSYTFKL